MSDAHQPEVVFFYIFARGFAQTFEQIVSIIVKTLRNTNLVTSRCFKMKKTSLRRLKSVKHKRYRNLTQTIMSRSSVAVQFGIQLVILAVHFYSFRVEVNGVVKISFPVFVISFVFVNLCNCYRACNSVFINIVSFVLCQFFQ